MKKVARKIRQVLKKKTVDFRRMFSVNPRERLLRALRWIEQHEAQPGGIMANSQKPVPYPEVTGYYIPTLLDLGERERALRFGRYLLDIQGKDGSFPATDNVPYIFDTGQILRGLMELMPWLPGARESLERACRWILSRQTPEGRLVNPREDQWNPTQRGAVPETVHLYATEPLLRAGQALGIEEICEGARKAQVYYTAFQGVTRFKPLSHFFAYVMEAFWDMGNEEYCREGMSQAERVMRPNGAVPAYPDVSWVCTTGLAQLSLVWQKMGSKVLADRAFDAFCRMQNSTGGWFGSVGRGCDYFPRAEISWAVKYYLDALLAKLRADFDLLVDVFPSEASPEDERLKSLVCSLPWAPGAKILDAGCGKGRFSRRLRDIHPECEYHGVDVSSRLLAQADPLLIRRQGSLLRLPYPEASFDALYCIEALEHSLLPENAIAEMTRILKPGGKIVVIDKNRKYTGLLETTPFEMWFDPEELTSCLRKHAGQASHQFLPRKGMNYPEDLFVVWTAIRS